MNKLLVCVVLVLIVVFEACPVLGGRGRREGQCPRPKFKEGCDPDTCVESQSQSRCQSFSCTGRDGQTEERSHCPVSVAFHY